MACFHCLGLSRLSCHPEVFPSIDVVMMLVRILETIELYVIVSDGLKVTSVVEYTGVGISMRSAFVCLTIKKDMRFCSLKKDPCEEKVDE